MRPLVGNRVTEKEIRDWLSEQGFRGKSAKFIETELHAIRRPGWLQVFRFEVHLHSAENESKKLFGALRSDERYNQLEILVFENLAERDQQLESFSQGLISVRRNCRL